MLKNHLKIAWRNLIKNRQQTIINLLGLTMGTASCLAILLYIFAQLGYDEQHNRTGRVYRVVSHSKLPEQNIDIVSATTSPPTAFALKEDFPEVKEATRILLLDMFLTNLLRSADGKDGAYEPRGYMADTTFFKVFDYTFVEGTAQTALDEPTDIVLSSSLAKKLFGNGKALGKTLLWGPPENSMTFTVSGVFDENHQKSHLNPNYIVSLETQGFGAYVRGVTTFAGENFAYNYIKLKPNSDASSVGKKLAGFLRARGGKDLDQSGLKKELTLQPVTDIHLQSKGISYQIDRVSDIDYLYFLLLLALFIQLMACINFINLSTARANKRAKEIGIRKVVGANRGSLIRQFLGESMLLSFFSMAISLLIVMALLPMMGNITGERLVLADIFNWKIGLLLVGLGIVTGFVSGTYPALLLSATKPIRAIQNPLALTMGKGNFRKVLVVFQFVISITLVASVIIVVQQFRYSQHKDLGFNKENLLMVRLSQSEEQSDYDSLKSQFMATSGVISVAGTNYAPSEAVLMDRGLHLPGKNPENKTLIKLNRITPDYLNTMNIPLLQGRDLKEGDQNQIVVNQATLKAFGIAEENAIGTKLLNTYGDQTDEFEVVGLVSDFNYASLKEKIAPLMLARNNGPTWLLVRFKTEDYQPFLKGLENIWHSTVKDAPFTFAFADQEIAQRYNEEKRLGQIATIFTVLAILISCLGLFGLVSYVAEQKKKEIGIRKVLGASIQSVVKLLTTDFLGLVGVAFLIATPIAYYIMHSWLEGYSYRIHIEWWVFALSGGFAVGITLLTVGFQSLKSALANPVKSLRTE